MQKLIITAAINGGVGRKAAGNPNIPEQPDEQIEAAIQVWKAGAAIVHIHARDKEGKPCQDPKIYETIKSGIRDQGCDIIINFTTGGGVGMTPEEKLGSLEAYPEMASLNMGMMNYPMPGGEYHTVAHSPHEIVWYVTEMQEKGIKPEIELYNPVMMKEVLMLIEKGLIEKPYYIQFVMGMPAQNTMEASIKNFNFMVDILPPDAMFSVCAVGRHQLPMTTLSMLYGGMVRVGLEDNLYYAKGEIAKSNHQLVERSVRIATELQRPIATPDEAREMLGIKKLTSA